MVMICQREWEVTVRKSGFVGTSLLENWPFGRRIGVGKILRAWCGGRGAERQREERTGHGYKGFSKFPSEIYSIWAQRENNGRIIKGFAVCSDIFLINGSLLVDCFYYWYQLNFDEIPRRLYEDNLPSLMNYNCQRIRTLLFWYLALL